MTKAKTAGTDDAKEAKKPAKADKTAKAEKTTKKPAPASAPAEKKPAAEKKPPAEKKPAPGKKAPPEKPAAKKPARPSKKTEIIPAPEAKPANSFVNAGLGVKTAGRKPALSVAPGIMTLGRPSQPKQEQTPRPSERRLAKKELADIRNFLLEKRERLLAGMRRELALQKERALSKAADDVDKATDAYDEDLSFEIATANDQELGDIQVALEKIDKGTYGECEICGCGISPSRLKILPSATTCVVCRGQEELTRRRDDGQSLFNIMEDAEGEAEPM